MRESLVVYEELKNRILTLFSMIDSAESSRCLVVWIAEHVEVTNRSGYGTLFGHLQQTAYANYILNSVALFERTKANPANSLPALFDYMTEHAVSMEIIKKFSSRDNVDFTVIESFKKELPDWNVNNIETLVPDSLNHQFKSIRHLRDKIIGHKEYLKMIAPRPRLYIPEGGCKLLPLAMQCHDVVAPLVWDKRFFSKDGNEAQALKEIRQISTQFAQVVSGEFAVQANGEVK